MAKRISLFRSKKSFTRKPGNTEPKKTILVVCEGETEEKYLKEIKNLFSIKTARIEICDVGRDTAPIQVVNKAELRFIKDGGYDYVYCVFDRDQHQSFTLARERIRQLSTRARNKYPFYESVSIPSFELWILLHFEKTDRSFTSAQEIIDVLMSRAYIQKYKKGDHRINQVLMDRVENALSNANWLENLSHIQNENPKTNVHQLIQRMKEFA
jgi:sugar diacid utilization regulator